MICFKQSEDEHVPEEPLDDAIEHDAEVPTLEGISPDLKNQLHPGEADTKGGNTPDKTRPDAVLQQDLWTNHKSVQRSRDLS